MEIDENDSLSIELITQKAMFHRKKLDLRCFISFAYGERLVDSHFLQSLNKNTFSFLIHFMSKPKSLSAFNKAPAFLT